MIDHYPDGHNIGPGFVDVSPEEREIERLERTITRLRAGLQAMKKWLPTDIGKDVDAKGLPPKEKNFSPDYLNDLAAMRRALGKTERQT